MERCDHLKKRPLSLSECTSERPFAAAGFPNRFSRRWNDTPREWVTASSAWKLVAANSQQSHCMNEPASSNVNRSECIATALRASVLKKSCLTTIHVLPIEIGRGQPAFELSERTLNVVNQSMHDFRHARSVSRFCYAPQIPPCIRRLQCTALGLLNRPAMLCSGTHLCGMGMKSLRCGTS